MIEQFFKGIDYKQSSFGAGLFTLRIGREEWYCCSYADAPLYKDKIVSLTNRIAIEKTKPGDWEFHHVIERNHLADLPLKALGLNTIANYYEHIIPTILVSGKEHRNEFNKRFRIGEFTQFYRTGSVATQGAWGKRELANNRGFNAGRLAAQEVLHMLDGMAFMYESAYYQHKVLGVISKNFFSELRTQVRHALRM